MRSVTGYPSETFRALKQKEDAESGEYRYRRPVPEVLGRMTGG